MNNTVVVTNFFTFTSFKPINYKLFKIQSFFSKVMEVADMTYLQRLGTDTEICKLSFFYTQQTA